MRILGKNEKWPGSEPLTGHLAGVFCLFYEGARRAPHQALDIVGLRFKHVLGRVEMPDEAMEADMLQARKFLTLRECEVRSYS